MKTKNKIFISKIIYLFLKFLGFKEKKIVKRKNILWNLDLSEAIELSIFLFGNFEKSIISTSKSINFQEDGSIIDIGANMGSQTLHFAKEFCKSKIFAVEPSKYSFQKLKENVSLNKQLSERIDLTQGFITNKNLKPNEIFSSWKLNSNTEGHYYHKGIKTKTEDAKIFSLDNFIIEKKINNISLIKLDVDGFELDVLESGKNFLSKHNPVIIMELAPYLYRENGYTAKNLVELIINYNFSFFYEKTLKKIDDINDFISKIKVGSSKNIVLQKLNY